MKNDRETGVIVPFQQNAEFYYQRGNRYLTEPEDLAKAEQYLRKAYLLEPEREEYILSFAETLHRMHRFEESLSVLLGSLNEENQNSAEMIFGIASVFVGLEEFRAASQCLHLCLEREPNGPYADRALDMLEKDAIIIRRNGSGNYVQNNIIHGRRLQLGITDVFGQSTDRAWNTLINIFPETAISCFKAENCDFRFIPYSECLGNSPVLEELDGLLFSPTYTHENVMNFLRSLKIPVVLYHAEYELNFACPQVIPDHSAAIDQVFELASRENFDGITIINYLHQNVIVRRDACVQSALKYGFRPDQIQCINLEILESPLSAVRRLGNIRNRLILSCSYQITYPLIHSFNEMNLVCGQDYQLVSYDNLNRLERSMPGIPQVTSIDYSRSGAARAAARLLIQSIRNPNAVCYQTIKFPTRLTIGETAFREKKGLI